MVKKMVGEKNPFKFLLLTHFAPTCQKSMDWVEKRRNGTTFVKSQLPDSGVYDWPLNCFSQIGKESLLLFPNGKQ